MICNTMSPGTYEQAVAFDLRVLPLAVPTHPNSAVQWHP